VPKTLLDILLSNLKSKDRQTVESMVDEQDEELRRLHELFLKGSSKPKKES
jgi:hypothetical protein